MSKKEKNTKKKNTRPPQSAALQQRGAGAAARGNGVPRHEDCGQQARQAHASGRHRAHQGQLRPCCTGDMGRPERLLGKRAHRHEGAYHHPLPPPRPLLHRANGAEPYREAASGFCAHRLPALRIRESWLRDKNNGEKSVVK